MLEVLLDSTPDGVDKSLGFAQALTKKSLKSFSANKNVSLVLYLTLVLLPAEQGEIFQKDSRKQNLVQACGTGDGKMIFALLEEIITLQVRFTPINVWEPNFQRPLTWAFIMRSGSDDRSQNKCRSWRKKRSGLKDDFVDPLEVILQVPNHGEVGGARSSKRSNNGCRYNSGSKSTYCDKSKDATVTSLSGSFVSELVFAVKKRILAKNAMSERLSH